MWIKAVDEKRKSAIYKGALKFSKKVELKAPVKSFMLRVTALGIFSVEFNDYVIPDYFMPAWTNYKKTVNLCEYDLTAYIGRENCLNITVARGWYSGRLGYIAKDCVYGKDTAIYAVIDVKYADGSTETIESDTTWQCEETNVTFADFFDGEQIDFSKRKLKRFTVVEKESIVEFRPYSYEPVCEIERIVPQVVKQNDNSVIYDFGKNFSGVINFAAEGKSGSVITVKYGEVLDKNGNVYTENLRSAKAIDSIKLGRGKCDFKPRFTYHGFRYAEILQSEKCVVNNVYGIVLSQKLNRTGSFECDNTLVNGIYTNILNGQESNFIAIPTDCPQRDERIGWSGDAQIFCDTAMYNSDCRKFYENYLKLLTDDCLPDGRVPVFAPFFAKEKIESTAAAGWSDAITIMPYKHYLFYGDVTVIKQCLPYAEKWCEYFLDAEKSNFGKRKIFNYGDWLSAGEITDSGVVNYCFLGLSLKYLTRMFGIVGNCEKAERYRAEHKKIKNKFRKKCVSCGKIISDTQTAYVLSYSAEFMSAEEIRDGLVNAVSRADYHLSTGFLGLRYLLPVLCDIGESSLAYKILLQETYPSWGCEINNGATTIWERWNGIRENGEFFEPSMNSFNHYSLGSVGYWLYSYMLGIRVEECGIKIKPYFGEGVNQASGYFSYRGVNIGIEWKNIGDNEYEYRVKTDKVVELEFDFADKTIKKQEKSANVYTFTLA